MIKKKTILLLLHGDLDYDGRAKRMVKIAKSLGNVIVLDASYSELTKSNTLGYLRKRHLLKRSGSKYLRHLAFWKRAYCLARECTPDCVFALNFFTAFPGVWISKLTGSALVYDAYELIIPEGGKKMSFGQWVWWAFEKLAVHRASLTIAANPERADLMKEHYQLKETPGYLRNIPDMPKETVSDNLEALSVLADLDTFCKEARVVLYQGDVSFARGLKRFVLVMHHLPKSYVMMVVGDGKDLDALRKLARDLTEEGRFHAVGRVSNEVLPLITKRCDIGIVTYPYQGLNNIYCSPNKVYEYIQAGLPIVTTDQPAIRSLLAYYNVGCLISEDMPADQIAQEIVALEVLRDGFAESRHRFLEDYNFKGEQDRVTRQLKHKLGLSR